MLMMGIHRWSADSLLNGRFYVMTSWSFADIKADGQMSWNNHGCQYGTLLYVTTAELYRSNWFDHLHFVELWCSVC